MFVLTGVFGVATFAAVAWLVPSIPAPSGTSIRRELAGLASPALWRAVAVGIIGFAGMFALYTYIVPVMVQIGGMPESLAPLVVGFYGVGMVVGTLLGGSWADRSAVRTLRWSLGLVSLSLAAFSLAAPWWWLALVPLLLAAVSASALVPSLQVLLVDSAPQAPQLAGALNHSALNLANAAGAWVGATVIAAGATLQVPAAAGSALAAVGLLLAWLLLRPRRAPASQ